MPPVSQQESGGTVGNLFQKWLCGALAASLSETLTMPLDVTKTRLQLAGERGGTNVVVSRGVGARGKETLYSIARHIVRNEGIAELFRGTKAAVLRQCICGGIGVGFYQPVRNFIAGDSSVSFLQKVAAASMTGTLGQFVAAPTDVIKVRLQADARLKWTGGCPRYQGPLHAFLEIQKTEGFRTFYRGLTPSLGRAAIMYGTSCAAYDHAKFHITSLGYHALRDESIWTHLASSSLSGLVAALVSTPFDVVKTRYMNQSSHMSIYKSPLDCIMKTARDEGLVAFYKGFTPTYLRLAPWQLLFFISAEQLSLIITGTSFTR